MTVGIDREVAQGRCGDGRRRGRGAHGETHADRTRQRIRGEGKKVGDCAGTGLCGGVVMVVACAPCARSM